MNKKIDRATAISMLASLKADYKIEYYDNNIDSILDQFLSFLKENIDEDLEFIEEQPEEKRVKVPLGLIKATCGWGKFCDVTGKNHYMLNEWSVEDSETFEITESQAKKLF